MSVCNWEQYNVSSGIQCHCEKRTLYFHQHINKLITCFKCFKATRQWFTETITVTLGVWHVTTHCPVGPLGRILGSRLGLTIKPQSAIECSTSSTIWTSGISPPCFLPFFNSSFILQSLPQWFHNNSHRHLCNFKDSHDCFVTSITLSHDWFSSLRGWSTWKHQHMNA